MSHDPTRLNPFAPELLEPNYYTRERRPTYTTGFRSPSRPADKHPTVGQINSGTISLELLSHTNDQEPMLKQSLNLARGSYQRHNQKNTDHSESESSSCVNVCKMTCKHEQPKDVWKSVTTISNLNSERKKKGRMSRRDSYLESLDRWQTPSNQTLSHHSLQKNERSSDDQPRRASRIQDIPSNYMMPGLGRIGRQFSLVE